ncbi:MAG TPA: SH3 domain-containing protein [Phycisphaerales bacterium]|nr:SH3 domain-containing protein [Phycisphaerales bacterium]
MKTAFLRGSQTAFSFAVILTGGCLRIGIPLRVFRILTLLARITGEMDIFTRTLPQGLRTPARCTDDRMDIRPGEPLRPSCFPPDMLYHHIRMARCVYGHAQEPAHQAFLHEVCVMKIRTVLVLLLISAEVALAPPMSVQVRSAKVRATASQLATVVTTVDYGVVVEARALDKGWYPVTTRDGKTGWLHESALSKKPIAMRSGTSDAATGVSSDEVAIAGKGFNEQVEQKLRTDGTFDFTWVDKMSAITVTEEQIQAFRQEGHLPGGAQ